MADKKNVVKNVVKNDGNSASENTEMRLAADGCALSISDGQAVAVGCSKELPLISEVISRSDGLQLSKRLWSLDNLRGLIIIGMVFAGLMSSIKIVPSWLKHPFDTGFSLVDIGAPLFLFAISMTIKDSFIRRKAVLGRGKAYGNMLARYACIVGLGALAMAVEGAYMGDIMGWSVLHTIGFAGILTVLVIEFPTWARAILGLCIIVVYQVLLDNFLLDAVLSARAMHSGFIGAFSWTGMLILFTVVADFYKKNRFTILLSALGFGIAFLISFFAADVCVSKVRVSSSFVFATMGISCLCFALFDFVPFLSKKPLPFLSWWGENPMLFYIADMLVIALTIVILGGMDTYGALPGWAVPIVLAAAFVVMSLLGFLTHKKHFKLKI